MGLPGRFLPTRDTDCLRGPVNTAVPFGGMTDGGKDDS